MTLITNFPPHLRTEMETGFSRVLSFPSPHSCRENWRKEVEGGRAAWVKQLVKAMRCGLMSHCLRKPWAKAEAEEKRGHVASVGPNLTLQAKRETHPDFTRISLFTYCASGVCQRVFLRPAHCPEG